MADEEHWYLLSDESGPFGPHKYYQSVVAGVMVHEDAMGLVQDALRDALRRRFPWWWWPFHGWESHSLSLVAARVAVAPNAPEGWRSDARELMRLVAEHLPELSPVLTAYGQHGYMAAREALVNLGPNGHHGDDVYGVASVTSDLAMEAHPEMHARLLSRARTDLCGGVRDTFRGCLGRVSEAGIPGVRGVSVVWAGPSDGGPEDPFLDTLRGALARACDAPPTGHGRLVVVIRPLARRVRMSREGDWVPMTGELISRVAIAAGLPVDPQEDSPVAFHVDEPVHFRDPEREGGFVFADWWAMGSRRLLSKPDRADREAPSLARIETGARAEYGLSLRFEGGPVLVGATGEPERAVRAVLKGPGTGEAPLLSEHPRWVSEQVATFSEATRLAPGYIGSKVVGKRAGCHLLGGAMKHPEYVGLAEVFMAFARAAREKRRLPEDAAARLLRAAEGAARRVVGGRSGSRETLLSSQELASCAYDRVVRALSSDPDKVFDRDEKAAKYLHRTVVSTLADAIRSARRSAARDERLRQQASQEDSPPVDAAVEEGLIRLVSELLDERGPYWAKITSVSRRRDRSGMDGALAKDLRLLREIHVEGHSFESVVEREVGEGCAKSRTVRNRFHARFSRARGDLVVYLRKMSARHEHGLREGGIPPDKAREFEAAVRVILAERAVTSRRRGS